MTPKYQQHLIYFFFHSFCVYLSVQYTTHMMMMYFIHDYNNNPSSIRNYTYFRWNTQEKKQIKKKDS